MASSSLVSQFVQLLVHVSLYLHYIFRLNLYLKTLSMLNFNLGFIVFLVSGLMLSTQIYLIDSGLFLILEIASQLKSATRSNLFS